MKLFRRQTQNKPPSSAMLDWQATDDGFWFTPNRAETLDSYLDELTQAEPNAQLQWQLLKELTDNGQAEKRIDGVFTSNEEICRLDAAHQRQLGLPAPYPFDIGLRSHGTLNEPEFRYAVQYLMPDGKTLHPERRGCLLHLADGWEYLLTGEQFALLEAVDTFNQREEDTGLSANLLEFAKIKGLARQTGTRLDQYLHKEDVVAPPSIRLRLREDANEFEILPEIPGADADLFEGSFDRYPEVQDVYSLQDESGGRTRVVLQEDQRQALRDVKRRRKVSQKQLAEIGQSPATHFDPNVVELDPSGDTPSFSERVHAIGVYESRTYPFVSPYKSQWIPGVLCEDALGERRKLTVRDMEQLTQLEQRLRLAKGTHQPEVEWQGQKYDVSAIKKHLPFLRRQIQNPQKPERGLDDDGPMVLIIKENVENVEYDELEEGSKWVEEPFRHLLETPPHLRSGMNLLPHQEEGVAWLQELWRRGYPGGLLADDMGLGKTLQLLAFLEWHHNTCRADQKERKPYLIVAPIALLENWAAEYPKFFDPQSLGLVTLYGSQLHDYKLSLEQMARNPLPQIEGMDQLQELRERRGMLDVQRLQDADLILTTYETVRDFQIDMGLVAWSMVILDEAQRIKTPGTLVTNALKALKADFRIACTGTPVENSLVDIWCIMDFVSPGHLGSAKVFATEFQRPLTHDGTNVRVVGERLRARMDLLLKRRLKQQILDGLPAKHLHVEDCKREMPPEQEDRYAAALEVAEEQDDKARQGAQVLQALHKMRDACDHPLLTDSLWERIPPMDLVRQSAKLRGTVESLEQIQAAGEKVILFADRRKTQHLLQHVVRELFGMAEIFIVNGDTPGSAQRENSMKRSRQQAVDLFQSAPGFNVIIMSPIAAGMGLNITGANHVVHYSRWWNPAKEDQASDRVYRIGQTRPVHIYHPMSVHPQFHTFDLILHELLERKRALSRDTLFPTEQVDVKPLELLGVLRGTPSPTRSTTPITVDDADRLEPDMFEALVAALFEKQGHSVRLTPIAGDKGVDVIVFPRDNASEGWLIQVSHTQVQNRQDSNAIRESMAARSYYEQEFSCRFQLAVVTNNEFKKEAHQLAKASQVTLHERKWLAQQLSRYRITAADVNRCELRRT